MVYRRIEKVLSVFYFLVAALYLIYGIMSASGFSVFAGSYTYMTTVFITIFCLCVFFLNFINQKQIKEIISFDPLTGLYTAKKFKEEVSKILKSRQNQNEEYSILVLDINSFRYITESFGKQKAESVLIALAAHFKKVMPKECVMCRNYTNNFCFFVKTAFMPTLEDIFCELTSVKSELKDLLPDHYNLEFSAGVFQIKNTNLSVDFMIEKANAARVSGKKSINPHRLAFYTEKLQIEDENEKSIIFDMNRAFSEHEFEVYYQPKFLFSDGKIIGAEALIRWNHKTRGFLSPGIFVPLFEKNGFIQKIDNFVFEDVCKFLKNWNKSGKNGNCPHPIIISCNISRVQLYNPNLSEQFTAIASKYDISPQSIEIELTESLMMDNKKRLLRAMNEIKKAGFSISIDDFGSGFSSLSLLKDIPANVIKLDKEFLNTDIENKKEHIIINSVINMAKELNLTTVAEGVEDEAQSSLLKNMGCDIVQGYYYAKPMPAPKFYTMLQKSFNDDLQSI